MIKKVYKNTINLFLDKMTQGLLWARLNMQRMLRVVSRYQNNPFNFSESKKDLSTRFCEDRYQAFSAFIPKDQFFSVLDIGCNQGYFLFRIAPHAGVCIGFEKAYNEVMYARSLAAVHRVKNVLFMDYMITPHNVAAIPAADIIICLSVFHHWVRDFGENNAIDMLRMTMNHCRRYFIFETGQYEEKGQKWTDVLKFMGANSHEWITNFLYDSGFSKVEMVGEFSTTLSDIPRKLYVAIKNQ